MLFKPDEFDNVSCSFSRGMKTFEKGRRHDNHVISFPARVFRKHKLNMTSDSWVSTAWATVWVTAW